MEMNPPPLPALLNLIIVASASLSSYFAYSHPFTLIGVHPLDEKYYASEMIRCKDGSKSFTRDRINDDFCDCPDGTDEPGTSACPAGKFYCQNLGSTPKFLFSSRVNDHFCDCCDGTDEYDGGVICPNTCVMGGNVAYKTINYDSTVRNRGSVNAEKTNRVYAEDSVLKIKGLEMMIDLQIIFVILLVTFWIFRQLAKSRRRHRRQNE